MSETEVAVVEPEVAVWHAMIERVAVRGQVAEVHFMLGHPDEASIKGVADVKVAAAGLMLKEVLRAAQARLVAEKAVRALTGHSFKVTES